MATNRDDSVLMTVQLTPEVETKLSRASVAEYLGVDEENIDARFGVVGIDPQNKLYAIMMQADKVSCVVDGNEQKVSGPFSNPKIATFGPVCE